MDQSCQSTMNNPNNQMYINNNSEQPKISNNVGDSSLGQKLCNDIFKDTEDRLKRDAMNKIKLKLQDIQDAHQRIQNDVVNTPVIIMLTEERDLGPDSELSESIRPAAKYIGKSFCNLSFKCENLQYTGSFKARGACNVLAKMSPSERSKGCTISGGRNFLSAMTYYGFKHSVTMNVVVPKSCPLVDKQKYKENFAIVKTYGDDVNDASLHALTYCNEIGSNYIHGSDRLDLMAGYGTVGLELLNQLEHLDAVLCPIGSGDLAASLVVSIKSLKSNCLIYGVECTAAPTMSRALQEKKPVMINVNPTVADSAAHAMASYNAFHIIRSYMDRVISVDEVWISRAMINLLEREKLVVEGAAACPVAAIMAGKVPELKNKNVVCILSGGNINTMKISRVIDRGMAAEGRLVKYSVVLPDEPGMLARLLTRITEHGADIKSVVPERAWMRRDIFTTAVNMLIETSDVAHAKDLEQTLLGDYPHSHFTVL